MSSLPSVAFTKTSARTRASTRSAMILREVPYLYPEQSKSLIWALAGAGSPSDVEQAEQLGFTVFPNVSDEMLADLYKAADAYMGFSKWEGYNLGISSGLGDGIADARLRYSGASGIQHSYHQ